MYPRWPDRPRPRTPSPCTSWCTGTPTSSTTPLRRLREIFTDDVEFDTSAFGNQPLRGIDPVIASYVGARHPVATTSATGGNVDADGTVVSAARSSRSWAGASPAADLRRRRREDAGWLAHPQAHHRAPPRAGPRTAAAPPGALSGSGPADRTHHILAGKQSDWITYYIVDDRDDDGGRRSPGSSAKASGTCSVCPATRPCTRSTRSTTSRRSGSSPPVTSRAPPTWPTATPAAAAARVSRSSCPGVGVYNAGAGLATAFAASSPVVLVAGQVNRDGIGRGSGCCTRSTTSSTSCARSPRGSERALTAGEIPDAVHEAFAACSAGGASRSRSRCRPRRSPRRPTITLLDPAETCARRPTPSRSPTRRRSCSPPPSGR